MVVSWSGAGAVSVSDLKRLKNPFLSVVRSSSGSADSVSAVSLVDDSERVGGSFSGCLLFSGSLFFPNPNLG